MYPLHKVEYLEYIKKFKEKILIPLEGDVNLKRIFKGFDDYLKIDALFLQCRWKLYMGAS